MNLKNILIVYTIPRTKEQKLALDSVKRILEKYKIVYSLANRDKLSKSRFIGRDFVIVVGGDGTFLRAAQFAGNHLMLGINSDVMHKEGFFMKCSKDDFENKLKKIIKSEYKIKKLPRLEAFINGKRIGALALNEFFIGARKSYQSAKYVIRIGDKKERQKSSGVLAATPAGTNSWAKSCCGKTLPKDSKDYLFVVREPYEGRVFKNYRLKYSIIKKGQKIDVFSEMLDGILVADSVGSEYSIKYGDKATIKMSDKHLNIIWEI